MHFGIKPPGLQSAASNKNKRIRHFVSCIEQKSEKQSLVSYAEQKKRIRHFVSYIEQNWPDSIFVSYVDWKSSESREAPHPDTRFPVSSACSLQLSESIPIGQVACLKAPLEPFLPLGAGAVVEGVRVHIALGALLDDSIANGGGRAHGL